MSGMAAITIRNLDPEVKQALRVRAAEQGRSMEEEARLLLRAALLADDRDGHLYPSEPGPRRFVPREVIVEYMKTAPKIDYKQFREDVDRYVDDSIDV